MILCQDHVAPAVLIANPVFVNSYRFLGGVMSATLLFDQADLEKAGDKVIFGNHLGFGSAQCTEIGGLSVRPCGRVEFLPATATAVLVRSA
jgi:hypothetical protein